MFIFYQSTWNVLESRSRWLAKLIFSDNCATDHSKSDASICRQSCFSVLSLVSRFFPFFFGLISSRPNTTPVFRTKIFISHVWWVGGSRRYKIEQFRVIFFCYARISRSAFFYFRWSSEAKLVVLQHQRIRFRQNRQSGLMLIWRTGDRSWRGKLLKLFMHARSDS